jgi:16S rRNA (adenine1518-N6/adenine1519-N6)-dimethyltransferase
MTTTTLLEQAQDFHAKRRLGQNFLVDADMLTQIAQALQIKSTDHVLEIGPGLGFLTAILLGSGAAVTAVELDRECVDILNSLALPHLNLIHEDFLKVDLAELLKERTKVIGNIPYNITSPIIARLFGEIGAPSPWIGNVESLVMTVQKEVGLRLCAKPGEEDYSMISVLVGYYAEAEMLFDVSRDNFHPIPEVTSAVVRMIPRPEPAVSCTNPKLLRQIVRAGFKQRRKMMRNNLSFLKLTHEEITTIFNKLNFDPQVRAERLGLPQFALLADEVAKIRTKLEEEEEEPSSAVIA